MFYWVKTSKLIKRYFNKYTWSLPNNQNKIYLTFDDGPTPEITNWVLKILETENIKATFFCIGKNMQQCPEIFNKILKNGHTIGNHTFNHVNGWKTSNEFYFENVLNCENEIKKHILHKNKLFRPPYGKITNYQSEKLIKNGYKIIMWDVLSADFDTTITGEKCLQNVLKNSTNGSIIVFHDSVKAEKNLKYTLPKAIKFLKEKGFVFDVLT